MIQHVVINPEADLPLALGILLLNLNKIGLFPAGSDTFPTICLSLNDYNMLLHYLHVHEKHYRFTNKLTSESFTYQGFEFRMKK